MKIYHLTYFSVDLVQKSRRQEDIPTLNAAALVFLPEHCTEDRYQEFWGTLYSLESDTEAGEAVSAAHEGVSAEEPGSDSVLETQPAFDGVAVASG
jgi:hypothetical protein